MFKVVVGCYEQIVLGYHVTILKSDTENHVSLEYEQQFSDHSHLGCIRCVASNNLLVVSGSSDESLSIFNMKTNSDLGPLQGHTGSVNEIAIPESMGNRILSCGDDGNICVWEVKRKKKGLIRMLRGHKGPINSIAVHPTGKLAMSASKNDGSLRTWNLITGRSAYVKNTKRAQIEFIRWGPSGDYYITASSRFVQVYDLATAKCVTEWETPQYILAIKFLPLIHSSKSEYVAIGDSIGYISIYSVPSGSLLLRYKAHENRVKDICGFLPNNIKHACQNEVWLVSVCSNGKLKIWKFDGEMLSDEEQEPTAESLLLLTIDTEARLTCVTVWQDADPSSLQKNESISEVSNEVVKGVTSKLSERLEVIYDQNPNNEIEKSTMSLTKNKKPISNGKIKKKAKQSTNVKIARLQKLRAALTEATNEEQSALLEEQSNAVDDGVKSIVSKKKQKVKFLVECAPLKNDLEVSKKLKTVEKSQERGRERQRKIRTKK